MQQITKDSIDAFLSGRRFKRANMRVEDKKMYLHDNKIAWIDINHQLWIDSCGWKTVTTKDRLNALPNVNIKQKNFEWFLNGEYWDGNKICVGRID